MYARSYFCFYLAVQMEIINLIKFFPAAGTHYFDSMFAMNPKEKDIYCSLFIKTCIISATYTTPFSWYHAAFTDTTTNSASNMGASQGHVCDYQDGQKKKEGTQLNRTPVSAKYSHYHVISCQNKPSYWNVCYVSGVNLTPPPLGIGWMKMLIDYATFLYFYFVTS